MKVTCLCRVMVILLLVTVVPGAQVVVVNGPGDSGTNFTSLAVAVAAAPPGSYLYLHPGQHAGFTCQGKALHIRGSGPATCTISCPSIKVDQVPTGECFTLAEMTISCPAPPLLELKRGVYHLDNVDVTGWSFSSTTPAGVKGIVEVRDATLYAYKLQTAFYSMPIAGLYGHHTRMSLDRCHIQGGQSGDFNQTAGAGLEITWLSVAETFDTACTGGQGYSYPMYASGTIPGHGGDGAKVSVGTMLFIYGGRFYGGKAGEVGSVMSSITYGNAGYGINTTAPCSVGGDGGFCAGGSRGAWGSAPAFNGNGIVSFTNSNFTRPRLDLVRRATGPDQYTLNLNCQAGTPCLLMVSSQSLWAPLGQLGLMGTLYINPLAPDFLFLGTFSGPATINIPTLPAALHYRPLWFQAINPPMGAQTITSNPVMLSYWP